MKIIHRVLRSLSRELKRVPRPLAYAPYKNLKTPLPALLAFLKLTKPDFQFIQVGANDGLLQDPLHEWIIKFDLSGILIEPQPEMCDTLRHLYSDRPSISVVNAAIADTNGHRSLFRVPPALKSADWMKGAASFDRAHLEKHLVSHPEFFASIEEVRVPTITPSTLFADKGIAKIDALIVDVEGFDYEILKLFDVAVSRPSVIQYEHRHLSHRDWEDSIQLLITAGYLVSYNFEDTLACHTSLFPEQ